MSNVFVVLVCKDKLPWTLALPFTSLKLNTYLRRILHLLLGFLLSHDRLLHLESTISAAMQAGIKRCVSYITFTATSAILCPVWNQFPSKHRIKFEASLEVRVKNQVHSSGGRLVVVSELE